MARFYPAGGAGGGTGSDECTAVLATDVVAGKTAVTSDSNDEAGNGGLADKNGTVQSATASLDTTNKRLQMTIPALGRYNTNSKLYAAFSAIASLIGLTAAKLVGGNTVLGVAGTALNDATISNTNQVRKNVIAYGKNGTKYTGAMTELAAKTYTPGTANQVISANQFLAGAQTILGDADLISANIVCKKQIFGVTGVAKALKTKSGKGTTSSGTQAVTTTVGYAPGNRYYADIPTDMNVQYLMWSDAWTIGFM